MIIRHPEINAVKYLNDYINNDKILKLIQITRIIICPTHGWFLEWQEMFIS